MCLFTDGYNVHCWLWRRLCKNNPWSPFHGLLHPWGIGKNSFFIIVPATLILDPVYLNAVIKEIMCLLL